MKKIVNVGSVVLGDGTIKIQSMTTTPTCDAEKTAQIGRLAAAGCEIVRVAVRDETDARAIRTIRDKISLPLVADIHFSAKLAVLAVENGADKVRVNPGNIGGENQLRSVADCLRAHHVPVRVGANTGSLEKEHYQKYGKSAKALVESALGNVAAFEKFGVDDIVISVKASSVPLTVEAYRLLASLTDYPLHVGVTEAGTHESGVVKSAIGIGALLLDGIGDTIRVSLTEDPVEEIYAAKRILRACNLAGGVDVVSCPTCGRCEWDSMKLAQKVEELTFASKKKSEDRRDGMRGKRAGRGERRGSRHRGGQGILRALLRRRRHAKNRRGRRGTRVFGGSGEITQRRMRSHYGRKRIFKRAAFARKF